MSDTKIVFIGKKNIREYVLVVLTELNSENTSTVIIKARGNLTSKAIDVAEILKNRFSNDQDISIVKMESHTEKLPTKERGEKMVSALEITMKKKNDGFC